MARSDERKSRLSSNAALALDRLVATTPLLTVGDDRIVIGCSGGPDSVALVALAARTQRAATVVYVDHGLRPLSASDFEIVRVVADRFDFASIMTTVVVDDSSNVEARARDARMQALEEVRRSCDAAEIWLAHTLDDQAETVIAAMLRGSGLAGLAAMASRRGRTVRPLLGVRRDVLREICRELHLATVDDPMNHDQRFLRVWIRDTLLPELNERTSRDIAPVLARQASLVREEHDYLEKIAAAAYLDAGDPPRVRSLVQMDRVVLRRVIRQFLGEPPIGGKHVEAALAVVYGERTSVALPNRRTLRRSGGILTVEPTRGHTE